MIIMGRAVLSGRDARMDPRRRVRCSIRSPSVEEHSSYLKFSGSGHSRQFSPLTLTTYITLIYPTVDQRRNPSIFEYTRAVKGTRLTGF
jgi:hypothetical protein